mmetsp:Transcript_22501/g.89350  ORF Transcript_22501/g.89350 Transcript_22501/m.89350 type:complete len:85 (+) Transcript_22501:6014-6268(+)
MSKVRVIDGFGSVALSDLLELRKKQEEDREKEEAAKRQRGSERAAKRAEKDAAFKTLLDAFDKCNGGCVCTDLAPGVQACDTRT